jgi:hypothetical protein
MHYFEYNLFTGKLEKIPDIWKKQRMDILNKNRSHKAVYSNNARDLLY